MLEESVYWIHHALGVGCAGQASFLSRIFNRSCDKIRVSIRFAPHRWAMRSGMATIPVRRRGNEIDANGGAVRNNSAFSGSDSGRRFPHSLVFRSAGAVQQQFGQCKTLACRPEAASAQSVFEFVRVVRRHLTCSSRHCVKSSYKQVSANYKISRSRAIGKIAAYFANL